MFLPSKNCRVLRPLQHFINFEYKYFDENDHLTIRGMYSVDIFSRKMGERVKIGVVFDRKSRSRGEKK